MRFSFFSVYVYATKSKIDNGEKASKKNTFMRASKKNTFMRNAFPNDVQIFFSFSTCKSSYVALRDVAGLNK